MASNEASGKRGWQREKPLENRIGGRVVANKAGTDKTKADEARARKERNRKGKHGLCYCAKTKHFDLIYNTG